MKNTFAKKNWEWLLKNGLFDFPWNLIKFINARLQVMPCFGYAEASAVESPCFSNQRDKKKI